MAFKKIQVKFPFSLQIAIFEILSEYMYGTKTLESRIVVYWNSILLNINRTAILEKIFNNLYKDPKHIQNNENVMQI